MSGCNPEKGAALQHSSTPSLHSPGFEDEDDDEYEDEANAKRQTRRSRLLDFVESLREIGSQIFQVFNAHR